MYRGFHWGSTCQEKMRTVERKLEDSLDRELALFQEINALKNKLSSESKAVVNLASELKEQKAILDYTMLEKEQKIKELESEIVELKNTITYTTKIKRRTKKEESPWQPYMSKPKDNKPRGRPKKIA